ncbi:cell division ATP-binding protein FtsE [Anoxynatronum buryatiense]|uniref:Cell division transport system ATP-binding protein n=1 Tax=Anoxynatronum buryatiense TaxID=489973 RepID=A0AA45WUB6_9CLOT|nr:ATP-binding cassette domain-containing protein [Anoxynatronum buryatiense]SMP43141.1 cell division transport system ATP-binding protein [Anoxynatronum buryatiense]
MITANDMTLTYNDGTEALRGINLKIQSGELVYITGPSGSGKTSLIKLLMGAEKPTAGQLQVLNLSLPQAGEKDLLQLRQQIGPVFQELKLIDGRSVLENVVLGMRFLEIPSQQWRSRASEALEKVRISHKMMSKAEHLSWGERQRVAIARAIARKPSLILADEPTGNLDHDNAVNILQLLDSLRNQDTSVIITTHATHLIDRQRTSQLIHISEGRIVPQ